MLRAYFIMALLFSTLAAAMIFGTGQASTDVDSTPAIAQSKTANFVTMTVIPEIPKILPNTQNFTYVLPNYNVTYSIVEMPPPDSASVNPYAYNIVVYGPPPFPIQIEFHQQATYSLPEKMTVIMPTNSYSTSIGCTSYPTQITMKQIDNESITPTPTSPPSPATTSSPPPTSTPYNEQPQQTYQEVIIGVAITTIVIGAGLGLLIYLIKRK